MVKYDPCAMEEFCNGDRLELAALTISVTVGCANPMAASSPKVKTIAKKDFTCVFFDLNGGVLQRRPAGAGRVNDQRDGGLRESDGCQQPQSQDDCQKSFHVCVFSFPVGFKSITTQRRLASARAHLPACHARPGTKGNGTPRREPVSKVRFNPLH